ncbi:uncharacterized protein LOC132057821 [Lycium ferocissimum]|uniref:uncharacterized protein LOC132057821 n=1 Tax=Lycium ferocissimum TaxID=112874 RepID=UPI0028167D0E|nr:uncharacterized protein LOC132057821 [Lycium ferocissimum]
MTVKETEAATFGAHQLQGIANTWYESWELSRGEDAPDATWDEFTSAFLDHFMPIEVREAKAEQFLKLKQNGRSVQDHYLEFVSLAKHAPHMVPDMRVRVRRFVGGLDSHLYDGANILYENGGMTISKMASVGQSTYTHPICGKCNRRHSGECRVGTDACFRCGQKGHFQKDYPSARQGTGDNVTQSINSAAPRHNQAQQGRGTTRSGEYGGGRTVCMH